MAQPIEMKPPARDPKIELVDRLKDAPANHAEAMLALYEIVQGLHDRGVLDLARGALRSSDKVLEIAVDATKSPAPIRGMRNLLLLGNMLQAIDPESLKAFTQSVPIALKNIVEKPGKPGLWHLIKDFIWNSDFRHGLAAVNVLLKTFGKNATDRKGADDGDSSVGR